MERSAESIAHQRAASTLLLLAFLWWLWTLSTIVDTLKPGAAPLNQRVFYVLSVDIVGLIAIAKYFNTWSLLWQVPLQALAAAALFEGVAGVIHLIFNRPHALVETAGLWYEGLLVCGVVAALAMKGLQIQFLGGHARHLTTRSSGR